MNNYMITGQVDRLIKALDGIEGEIGKVAETRQELIDIGNGLADIQTGLADLTGAVRELTQVIASAHDRPRRWWTGGRRAAIECAKTEVGR